MNSKLVCVDLGNTSVHCGAFVGDDLLAERSLETRLFCREPQTLHKLIEEIANPGKGPWDASFCSVVPKANTQLEAILSSCVETVSQFSSETCEGLDISYPNTTEVGADRLANAIAAQTHYGTPAIVIDLGTATTFDIVGSQSGYEGGIIAPGLALMTEYLAERTALLPKLDHDLSTPESFVGRSTEEAIRLGCSLGFPSMIQGILEKTKSEVADREGSKPVVIVTGGTARELTRTLDATWLVDSHLTLRGLAEAYRRERSRH